MLRVHGLLEPIRYRIIQEDDFHACVQEITPPTLWKSWIETHDVDFAYAMDDLARFRVNLFQQSRGSGAVFRIIPSAIATIDQLGLPRAVSRLIQLPRGLVLVTGPSGSGKSTTLAALLDRINETRQFHIITLEDPIEFTHRNKRSLITQREIGTHAPSFPAALKAAMREDPDLILVGEMRDLETMEMALQAAESGLFVVATLHTNSAAKAVDRIIDAFPVDEQAVVRGIIGGTLRGVLAQQLVRTKAGGRVAAVEVLISSPAIGNMIREGKTHQISNAIRAGKSQGMIAMDDCLQGLVRTAVVEPLSAYEKAVDKKRFRQFLRDELNMAVGPEEEAFDAMPELEGR
jgi:twitching motility protein PilT